MSLAETEPRVESRSMTRVVRRLTWGIADQLVSSLSNFALGLYVARTLGASAFGAFTLAFVTYSVVLNASRGIATDPLLVRHSGEPGQQWREATSAATGLALLTGLGSGALCLVAGLFLPSPLDSAFVVLGIGLPGLVLQDSWRFAFFAAGRGSTAFVNDVLWTALIGVALAALHFWDDGLVGCMLAFGGTATIAALYGAIQARVIPRPALARGWLSRHRHLSFRYLAENVTASGASQIRSFVLGGVAGLAAVGYVRGAEIMMGPFLVVLMGICQVAVPEAARVFRRSSARLIPFCLALGGGQALLALLWGAFLLLIFPLGPGRLLLGSLWSPVHGLLVPVILNVTVACLMTSAVSGLRAMGVARRSLRAQVVTSGAYVTFGSLGAVLGGAAGTCWGVLAGNTLGCIVTWLQLRTALAAHHEALPPVQTVEQT